MPGKVKVRVLSARHLPVMDRSSENTDAFAEVKFGDSTHKTEVYRKSLNPAWNSEWFRFEAADDRELQDEPLQIRQVFCKWARSAPTSLQVNFVSSFLGKKGFSGTMS